MRINIFKKSKQEEEEEGGQPPNYMFERMRMLKELGPVVVGVGRAEGGDLMYIVIEPTLTSKDIQVLEAVKRALYEKLSVSPSEPREAVEKRIEHAVKVELEKLNYQGFDKIAYYVKRDMIWYGKIEPMLRDPDVEDISCNGPGTPIYVWHRFYENLPSNVSFTRDELVSFIFKLAYRSGRSLSYARPLLDASLPEGHRIQITFGEEITGGGANFTIRKFKTDPITVVDLINFGTLTPRLAAYLWMMIERNMSLLIAGGTASGKTTTLNALTAFIPFNYKVITIEDTRELNLYRDNWIAQTTRETATQSAENIGLFDLLKAALRQRPDVIIVGEVRGEEAYTLLQAVATGHGGLSTIHGESVEAALERLSTRPMNVPKEFIATALNAIMLQVKGKIGNIVTRKAIRLAEIAGYDRERDDITLVDSFSWDPKSNSLIYTGSGVIPKLMEQRYGIGREEFEGELARREVYLKWLAAKGIRHYKDVFRAVNEYLNSPEQSYARAVVELKEIGSPQSV